MILKNQLGLFFKDDYKGKYENISLKLQEIFGDSKQSTILPLPEDAPSEVPRLTLNFEGYNINVSKNRLDIFSQDKDIIRSKLSVIVKTINDNYKISICRVGFVNTIFVEDKINSVADIIKDEYVKGLNLKEIQIRINNPISLIDYRCNNIESIEYGSIIRQTGNEQQEMKTGVIINKDINTSEEETAKYVFDSNNITALFDEMNNAINKFILYRK